MIFNDIVMEYKRVESILVEAKQFFMSANKIISNNDNDYKEMTSILFSTGLTSQSKDNAISKMNENLNKIHPEICKLNTHSRTLIRILGILENIEIKNISLKKDITTFINRSNFTLDIMYNIIETTVDTMKKKGTLFDLINGLYELDKTYSNILFVSDRLSDVENDLLETIPEVISQSQDYEDFTIQTLTKSETFDQITTSIDSLADIINNIFRLKEIKSSERYYIRKVETGSLLITITSLSIAILPIIKFIDYCLNKYIEYTKSLLDIQEMRIQLIQNELDTVSKLLDLNPNLENKSELIEKACTGAFKYFKLNPKFKIGDKEFSTGEQIKSIATTKIDIDI